MTNEKPTNSGKPVKQGKLLVSLKGILTWSWHPLWCILYAPSDKEPAKLLMYTLSDTTPPSLTHLKQEVHLSHTCTIEKGIKGRLFPFRINATKKKRIKFSAVSAEVRDDWLNSLCETIPCIEGDLASGSNDTASGSNEAADVEGNESETMDMQFLDNEVYESAADLSRWDVTIKVNEDTKRIGLNGSYWLSVNDFNISLIDKNSARVICYWSYKNIRGFGRSKMCFSLEAGSNSSTGHGLFSFLSDDGEVIFESAREKLQKMKDSNKDSLKRRESPMPSASGPLDSRSLSKPNSLERSAKPNSLDRSAKPNSLDRSAKPNTLDRSAKPNSLDRSAKPNSMERSAKPNSLERSTRLISPDGYLDLSVNKGHQSLDEEVEASIGTTRPTSEDLYGKPLKAKVSLTRMNTEPLPLPPQPSVHDSIKSAYEEITVATYSSSNPGKEDVPEPYTYSTVSAINQGEEVIMGGDEYSTLEKEENLYEEPDVQPKSEEFSRVVATPRGLAGNYDHLNFPTSQNNATRDVDNDDYSHILNETEVEPSGIDRLATSLETTDLYEETMVDTSTRM